MSVNSRFFKDQENPNFSAFDTFRSLTNDPVFDPGRLGKRSDGTKITKFYEKPEVERVKMHAKSNRRYDEVNITHKNTNKQKKSSGRAT